MFLNLFRKLKLALIFLLIPGLAFAQSVNLKFQTTNTTGEQAYKVQKKWCDLVSEVTDGRINIDLLPLDAVVKSTDLLTGVHTNIIQGAITSTAVFAGEDIGFGLIGDTIAAWDSDEDILKYYYAGGGFEVVDSIMQDFGTKLVGVIVTGGESLPSKVPLRNIEDFKGVKIRAPAGPVHELFSKMGASPVNLPSSEIYNALDKGIIDAADFSTLSSNHAQGVTKIAPYPIYPGFHSSPTVLIFMNIKEYQKLARTDQILIESLFKGMALDSIIEPHYEDKKAYKDAVSQGYEPIAWSQEEVAKVREMAKTIWANSAKKSTIANTYLEHLTTYLESQGSL